MLINPSPTSARPDTVHSRAPAQQQAASEGAERSSAVTLDISASAIARAKEAMRVAQERQAAAPEAPIAAAPVRPAPPAPKLTAAEALDPEKVHREELKALLTTHTGAQLYVIQKTLDELMGNGTTEPDPNAERHDAEARARREAMHVVQSQIPKPVTKVTERAPTPKPEPTRESAPLKQPAPPVATSLPGKTPLPTS